MNFRAPTGVLLLRMCPSRSRENGTQQSVWFSLVIYLCARADVVWSKH